MCSVLHTSRQQSRFAPRRRTLLARCLTRARNAQHKFPPPPWMQTVAFLAHPEHLPSMWLTQPAQMQKPVAYSLLRMLTCACIISSGPPASSEPKLSTERRLLPEGPRGISGHRARQNKSDAAQRRAIGSRTELAALRPQTSE